MNREDFEYTLGLIELVDSKGILMPIKNILEGYTAKKYGDAVTAGVVLWTEEQKTETVKKCLAEVLSHTGDFCTSRTIGEQSAAMNELIKEHGK